MTLLEARGLVSGYGRAQVLFEVDLKIEPGEVHVLLGRNGAGKSTLIKTINGIINPWQGEVLFEGQDLAKLPPHKIAQLGIGYVPEERRIFTDLTVMENLEVGRQPARPNTPTWTEERLFSLFPNLAEMRHRRGGEMSGGEQQMLSIARTLMGNPRLVLLDEPSEGLAPVIVDAMVRSIIELKESGLSVLLSEQNLRFAKQVADRATVIEKGCIQHLSADAQDPKEQAIWSRFLGLTD